MAQWKRLGYIILLHLQVQRHGEAGSVDTSAVGVEHECLQAILADYNLKDIFNVDKTGFLAFATPDCGLETR